MFTRRHEAIRRLARNNADSARTATFRMRAREMGGVNARNRAHIVEQAEAAAHAAAEQTYLDHGYRPCAQGCGRLASPSYADCPNCTPRFAF